MYEESKTCPYDLLENGETISGYHQVLMNRATLKVAIKPSGKIVHKYIFQVMDPANGGHYKYFGNSNLFRKDTNVIRMF